MIVSVFGSALPKQGEAAWQEAYDLGSLLARNGHTVMTGGYSGSMTAVSRGAAENGGHVIGVTCEEIENWRPTPANEWVKEERKMGTLVDRIQALIRSADAILALPGGIGTLTEISVAWNLLAIESVRDLPIILIGPAWQKTITTFLDQAGRLVPPKDRGHLSFAADINAALDQINTIAEK